MEKKVNFGLGIATGTEGLMYPIPYASVREVVDISILAEKLGFDSVWGNDHITTQQYVYDEFGQQPRYYAPLLTLAAIAEHTTTLKLATALLVIPFRNPAIVAKELSTLDHLSNGRLLVGVGLGAYREEFEAEFGDKAKDMVRGKLFDESISMIHRIFTEEKVSQTGTYFDLKNIQSFPKPVQSFFPFYFGGNSEKGLDRTVRYGRGWLPFDLTVDEIAAGVTKLREKCEAAGREYDIDVAPQFCISIGRTHEEACKKFEQSQVYKHTISLEQSTLKGKKASDYTERNLVGSPDEIIERIEAYRAAGVTTFSAMIFANNTIEDTREDMQFFSETVIAHYNK
ncbi:TIGR03619 family F420-dependent LLM class oxidoreductase [bacterium]|nr:TIGR03619 family F420-dependent LLM class oxidoreductase [bacterium]